MAKTTAQQISSQIAIWRLSVRDDDVPMMVKFSTKVLRCLLHALPADDTQVASPEKRPIGIGNQIIRSSGMP
jgi:hypothetical protein